MAADFNLTLDRRWESLTMEPENGKAGKREEIPSKLDALHRWLADGIKISLKQSCCTHTRHGVSQSYPVNCGCSPTVYSLFGFNDAYGVVSMGL